MTKEDVNRLSTRKYFIVANLHNNQNLMFTFLNELIATLRTLLVFTNNTNSLYVSIYESASTDNTPEALRAFTNTLVVLQIPHTIVSNEQHRRGEKVIQS